MTERERRRLLRQHPAVTDWYDVLRQSADGKDADRADARASR
jgi:hypothetical protein